MSNKVEKVATDQFSGKDEQLTNIKFFFDGDVTAEELSEYLAEVDALERNGMLHDITAEVLGS